MIKATPLAIALCLLIQPAGAGAAGSIKAAPGAFRVTATLNPSPARQGAEVVTVVVKDLGGKPVKGAMVKIGSSMPTMSMTGPSVTARESAPGIYTTKIDLNFATLWKFDIRVTRGGRSGSAQISSNVT